MLTTMTMIISDDKGSLGIILHAPVCCSLVSSVSWNEDLMLKRTTGLTFCVTTIRKQVNLAI